MPPEPVTSSHRPIRIKFLSKAQSADREYERWLRRLPGGYRRWGNCEFIFEQDCNQYDWLVVYDDLPRHPGQKNPFWEEILACPRARTLLITTEPSSIKLYGYGFLNQFGWVLSSQEPRFIRHPGLIHRQAGLVWFYGNTDIRGTFDHLAATVDPPEKSADISTVCSAKRMRHTLHANRVAFTHALKTAIPDMEIYGQGVREIPDKADALDPFLGWCLPIYHGCPNAADYFPEESFIPFDMLDFDAAKDLILKAIRDDEYSRRLPAIREARRLALHEYATFPQIARIVTEHHKLPTADPANPETIISRHLWRKRHPVEAISQLVQKSALQLRQRLTQPVVQDNRPTI